MTPKTRDVWYNPQKIKESKMKIRNIGIGKNINIGLFKTFVPDLLVKPKNIFL